jgi:menaquinone-dependent protoporphyrinogen oxidase
MSVPPVLILYASSYGQTAKIARRLAERLQGHGLDVALVDARTAGHEFRPDGFGGVVIGSSLIARGIQPPIRKFIAKHVETLNRMPTGFFQVSASAGSAYPEGRAKAVTVLEAFLQTTGLRPRLKASIAGAINFTQYGFLLRWYMKRASAMHGGATDTSRDHEYTDWDQVDRFADDYAALLAPGTTRHPAVASRPDRAGDRSTSASASTASSTSPSVL